jgi:replication-associated recombination protein RarA
MIGHDKTRAMLERALPKVTLLSGPDSVGKKTLARHLISYFRIQPADTCISEAGDLSIERVRRMQAWLSTAPFGKLKVALIDLDRSSAIAQNALLKTLEEPPPRVRFLLTASEDVLPTVTSRATVYRLGYLTPAQVTEILVHGGMNRATAGKAAQLAAGQVNTAIRIGLAGADAWSNVVALMRSISLGDRDGFHRAFTTWDAASSELLTTWFIEATSNRFQVFSMDETFGLEQDRNLLTTMIGALSRNTMVRPRLGTRAALEPFLAR